MVLQTQELVTRRTKKHSKNHEIYKELLQCVYNKIKMKNELGHLSMMYVLSPIMPGKPLINLDHAIMYITKKLKAGNFKIQCANNVLYIDWS